MHRYFTFPEALSACFVLAKPVLNTIFRYTATPVPSLPNVKLQGLQSSILIEETKCSVIMCPDSFDDSKLYVNFQTPATFAQRSKSVDTSFM